LLVKLTGIVTVNKEMNIEIIRCLGDAVRKNLPKNGEPAISISFTTMLQHTGQIWLRIS